MKTIEGMLVFTIGELRSGPTLCVGQTDDLKYDDGKIRVWASRCGLDDFELDPFSVEHLIDGRWVNMTTSVHSGVHIVGQPLGARASVGWVQRVK